MRSPPPDLARRRLVVGLAAAIAAACGEGPRALEVEVPPPEPDQVDPDPPPPCPTCGPKPEPAATPPDLPSYPVAGVECLNWGSYRLCDPVRAMQVLADLDVRAVRMFTTLARWGSEFEVPPRGWFVDVLEDAPEWQDRIVTTVREGRRHGILVKLCLFDKPSRPDKKLAELAREVDFPRWAGTWLDERSEIEETGRIDPRAAIELAEIYLERLPAAEFPNLIVETSNEPHLFDGLRMPDDELAAWLRGRGYRVARGTRFGDDGPYRNAELVSEHAWGPPGVIQPWPPRDRLEALRRAHPGVAIAASTDGFSVDDELTPSQLRGASRDLRAAGMSCFALFRTTPDRWTTDQLRLAEALVAGASTQAG